MPRTRYLPEGGSKAAEMEARTRRMLCAGMKTPPFRCATAAINAYHLGVMTAAAGTTALFTCTAHVEVVAVPYACTYHCLYHTAALPHYLLLPST